MLVYGRCLLYGVDQTRFFQKAMIHRDRLTMMVLPKKIGYQKTRVMVDQDMKVVNSDSDELLRTQYDFSDIPIMFMPKDILIRMAQESDVPSFVSKYALEFELYAYMLDRGFVEIEIDDWDNVQEASTFIKIIQDKCGMNVYCLEEVAWRRGFISIDQLKALGEKSSGTEYGEYVLSLYNRFSTDRLPEEVV